MPLVPLTATIAQNLSTNLQLIATDMDGTLTEAGKFTPELLRSLVDLAQAGWPVVIVTGRSAGWVSGLVHYLPVWGAIAENGGLFYQAGQETAQFFSDLTDLDTHRQKLAQQFAQLQAIAQGYGISLQPAADNAFRLTDWTFEIQNVPLDLIPELQAACERTGWGFTYSTVQGHIKPLGQDKAIALQRVLQQHFPQVSPEQIITIGDSPNDSSLFDPRSFPQSVGVANVQDYLDQLPHLPAYLTTAAEGAGFQELAYLLLQASKRQA